MPGDDPGDSHAEVRIPLREYFEALRDADEKLRDADQRFAAERDRRYTELAIEREKALKIKESADERALRLQAATQEYKDEKANELREQISAERGLYVTREELAAAVRELQATIRPLTDYTSGAAGQLIGAQDARTERRLDAGQLIAVLAVLIAAISVAAFLLKK